MATTNTNVFAQGGRLAACVCTTANSNYTQITGLSLLDTAEAANGAFTEYSHIAAKTRGTVTATQLQLFAQDGSGNVWYISDASMAAGTLGQTTAIGSTALPHIDGTTITEQNPLRLASGWKLYAGIGVSNSAGIVFTAQAKDY